ncbi:peptidase inhibitor family I36 protein [Streptomyces kronopolitis]|uniref:peptidase inhibitor family I36 protein n=1 Tax=Streptomyces kronopolitis TaxID=1612435 RepID=UPI003D95701D
MRIGHMVAASTAAAALVLGPALPASADGSRAVAGSVKDSKAKVVVYEQPLFKGRHATLTRRDRGLGGQGWCPGSAKNVGRYTALFFTEPNYGGARLDLEPGDRAAHLNGRFCASLLFR